MFAAQSNPLHKHIERITELANRGLHISEEELFSYALFYEWADEPGWRTYKDLASKLPDRRKRFDDYVRGTGTSVVLRRAPVRDISESLGIGASLAVASRIIGVTSADFEKISETSKNKTLDFEYTLRGTNGVEITQVEGKGMHDGKGMAVHRARLAGKKDEARGSRSGSTPLGLLGTLCDIQFRGRNESRIFLQDPPGGGIDIDPIWYRLLLRLKYYHQELSKFSTGRLVVALANRIRTIEVMRAKDWTSLDGVALVGPRGEDVKVGKQFATTLKVRGSKRWGQQSAFGRVYDLRLTQEIRENRRVELDQIHEMEQRLYFRGLDRQVVVALALQDFERILALKYDDEDVMVSDRYRAGRLTRLSSGLVVGVIRDEKWDQKVLPKIWADLRQGDAR